MRLHFHTLLVAAVALGLGTGHALAKPPSFSVGGAGGVVALTINGDKSPICYDGGSPPCFVPGGKPKLTGLDLVCELTPASEKNPHCAELTKKTRR